MSVGPERIDTVVVAVDGSEFSQRALPVAQRLARRLDATILLFSAVPTEDDVPTRRTELSAAAGTLEGVKVEEDVVVNVDPAGAIHETLKRIGNAVPCMTSHGRGRSAAVLGSVANEVLARGHDPLVLVGPMGDEETDGTGVYAAVDEHPGSAEVVVAALRWADLLDEHLTVITVAEPVPP
ncbi:MAG: hypothetical protein JWP02_1919, partial [Acidimicrobiales bacterium]|nr:hypothetical protein [Acidimicrobiales bacterium]